MIVEGKFCSVEIEGRLNPDPGRAISLMEFVVSLQQIFRDEQEILSVMNVLNLEDTDQLYQKFISIILEKLISSEVDERIKLAAKQDPDRVAIAMIRIILDDHNDLVPGFVSYRSPSDLFETPREKLIALQSDILLRIIEEFVEQLPAERRENEKGLCLIPIFLDLKTKAKHYLDCPYSRIRKILHDSLNTLLKAGPRFSECAFVELTINIGDSLKLLLDDTISERLPEDIRDYVRCAVKDPSLIASVLQRIARGRITQ